MFFSSFPSIYYVKFNVYKQYIKIYFRLILIFNMEIEMYIDIQMQIRNVYKKTETKKFENKIII